MTVLEKLLEEERQEQEELRGCFEDEDFIPMQKQAIKVVEGYK